MSRRRKYHDDEEDMDTGHRSSKRRRPDNAQIEERLESLITRVGEKSTSSLESNLEGLAGVLEADLPNYKSKIIKILCDCAVALPEKITVYTTLVGLLNAKNYSCGGEFIEALGKNMKDFMKSNEWNKARYVVRFFADLVNCRVIEVASLMSLYENFVAVTMESDIPQVRSDWFIYAVLNSLPWVGCTLDEKKGEELTKLMKTIEEYLGKRKKDHVPFLRVWHGDSAHEQQDYLDSLWQQVTKLRRDQWLEKIIMRPYMAFHSVLSEALVHNLPPFTPPAHSSELVYPIPTVVFRMFDPTDAPEGPPLPGAQSIERYLVEDQINCLLNTYFRDRKECAAQLLNYHAKKQVPLNYVIVEVMFGQLFALPQAPRIHIFYMSLFLELCKLQPGSLPQVLAQASEMLYERLDHMSLQSSDRFVVWFSHHLSNFQFRWSWEEWTDCLNVDLDLPKPKFVMEVLTKCLRLSYHQRIAESVPESYAPLMPSPPEPVYKYGQEGAESLPGYTVAQNLTEAIRKRGTPEMILDILKETPNPKDVDGMEDETSFNALKIDVFVQTLLHLGSKSFSHSFSALAKFHSVLRQLADTEESQIYVLRVIKDVWQNQPQRISVLVDKLLRTQVISCPAIANWLFSPFMASNFTRMYVWDILHATINTMNKHVKRCETELEEARQNMKKKEDGDMDSDDDGYDVSKATTESQIESLVEKLESAQSEEKKLFLIIFQRFVMVLGEHMVSCENKGEDFHSPWFVYAIQRLQQIFLVHYHQVVKYTTTLENLVFTNDTDSTILEVFTAFRSLQS
ncbi:nuclear cap-binding protein subunit 1-like [Diadema antillarum]|uniref:nuclear cap-binding protein subunit 1-like n=1 Tax=Diadema antillarum TaxID=105358 RepID=UPI003A8689D9